SRRRASHEACCRACAYRTVVSFTEHRIMDRHTRRALSIMVFGAALPVAARAQTPTRVDERLLAPFTYRNLGPFRMGARVSDVAVPTAPASAHNNTFYVAYWTGGVWKTTNNGTT